MKKLLFLLILPLLFSCGDNEESDELVTVINGGKVYEVQNLPYFTLEEYLSSKYTSLLI